MKLRTKKADVWITEREGGGEAQFLIRPMTPKEDLDLLQACTRKAWDRGQRFDEPDYYLFKIEKIDRIIIDWKGIEDENGKSIPCTRENKEVVYLNNALFIDRVIERSTQIQLATTIAQEEERKNL